MEPTDGQKENMVTAEPVTQPPDGSASRRVLRSRQSFRKVIDSLCPDGVANEHIAARLFAENFALGKRPAGDRVAHPSGETTAASPESPEIPPDTRRSKAGRCPNCEAAQQAETQQSDDHLPRARGSESIYKSLIDRKPPTKTLRIWSYLKAKFGGSAANSIVSQRRHACVRCSAIEQVGAGLFCQACGCGHRRDANLEVKTRMRQAECPLGRWPPNS